jgi:hypothetical protein
MKAALRQHALSPIVKVALFLVMTVATLALANVTSGPINTLPKIDVMETNGTANRFSNDPQIASFVFDATGTTAATTSYTVFADATHFAGTQLRGAGVADSTTGYEQIARSGLYKVDVECNATGTTADLVSIDAAVSLDGGSTFTEVSGSQAVSKVLTGILQVNLKASGYVSIASANAGAALGQTIIVMRGKDSANTLTCSGGGGLRVQRVDTLQPAQYP